MRRKQIVIKKLEDLDILFKNLKYAVNHNDHRAVDQNYQLIQRLIDEIFIDIESEDER